VLRFGYRGGHIPVGSWLTVTGLPGAPRLEVVGLAVSISGSADAWVVPAEIARLRPPGTPCTAQMLYRFGGTATTAAIGADVAAVSAALPAGAVTGTRSYLTVKAADTARVAVYVPVLIACGLVGLVLALLAVATVISGTVAAGSTRIRILKIIGFSPGQVTAAYAGRRRVRLRARGAGRARLGGRRRGGGDVRPDRAGGADSRPALDPRPVESTRRRLGAWWSPQSSKLVDGALRRRRVRFPSASATSGNARSRPMLC
jgi:hypothetical protein